MALCVYWIVINREAERQRERTDGRTDGQQAALVAWQRGAGAVSAADRKMDGVQDCGLDELTACTQHLHRRRPCTIVVSCFERVQRFLSSTKRRAF